MSKFEPDTIGTPWEIDRPEPLGVRQKRLRRTKMGTGLFVLRFAYVTLLLLLAPSGAAAKDNKSVPSEIVQVHITANAGSHLSTSSSVRDLLNHRAFANFARLILPWDDRSYDECMRLSDIGSLLPYHSHVDPAVTVAALNRMIDDVSAGNPVFYNFYTDAQKQEQPAKANTGLFFFRGKPGAPFAVISPGGGFAYVGSVHEGFPYAVEISNKGYNAFVLKYRAGYGGTVATEDLAAALSYIFHNAAALGVSTDDYSLWGSSAGARMAATIGSHGVADYGGADLPKPATVVMAYTAHSDYSSDEPPTFVVVGERDGIAPPSVMERRVAALREAGTEVEYHKYKGLGHGFGPGTGTVAEGWLDDAVRFWERFIKTGNGH
jgi:acetyl esterase/lipase